MDTGTPGAAAGEIPKSGVAAPETKNDQNELLLKGIRSVPESLLGL